MTSLLVPITIQCTEHNIDLDSEYDELRHIINVSPCKNCMEEECDKAYSDGYEDSCISN